MVAGKTQTTGAVATAQSSAGTKGISADSRVTADTNQRLVAQIARREQTESALAQTEQELVQAAKLATIGSLSASLNHELNQPLTALQSYSQNTSRMLEKNMLPEAQANLAAMLKLIQRLSNIVAQFKDFSRPGGAGKNQPQALQKIVLDALGIVQHQCQRQGVKRLKQPEQAVLVLVDPMQLEQVLVKYLQRMVFKPCSTAAKPVFRWCWKSKLRRRRSAFVIMALALNLIIWSGFLKPFSAPSNGMV